MSFDVFNIGLPKWPQMYTTGIPVSVEQAKEIIRRTDYFFGNFWGGNNHKWNKFVCEKMGIPPHDLGTSFENLTIRQNSIEDFHARWGYIFTNYVDNTWISSCFIFGPHGWMHPDGTIGFVDNIGKWPSIEEVHEDWIKIAEAFPFLDVGVTLMSEEGCTIEDGGDYKKLVSFAVKDGNVSLIDPAKRDVHANHPEPRISRGADALKGWDLMDEVGISVAWIEEWAELNKKLKK